MKGTRREGGRNRTHGKPRAGPLAPGVHLCSVPCVAAGCAAGNQAGGEMPPSPLPKVLNLPETVTKQISAATWQPSQTFVARKLRQGDFLKK